MSYLVIHLEKRFERVRISSLCIMEIFNSGQAKVQDLGNYWERFVMPKMIHEFCLIFYVSWFDGFLVWRDYGLD